MTKQEEIKARLLLALAFCDGKVNHRKLTYNEKADEILRGFHSQGVVIKVERELPHYRCGFVFYEKCGDGEHDSNKPVFNDIYTAFSSNQKQALDNAGYVATEPLMVK